jgi:hypothetical protein
VKLNRSFVALSVIGGLGMGLLLAGCGDTGTTGSTTSQDAAKQQFLNDRSGTPGPGSGTPGAGGRPPGVFGSITKINGNQITVKSQADGTETVVQPGTGATMGKQADAQASDITQGAMVAATGTMTGGVLDAQLVQIGGGNFVAFGSGGGGGFGAGGFNGTPGAGRGGFNGTPGAGRNGGFNGTPGVGGRFRGTPGPNGTGAPGAGRNFAVGTVAKVDGNTVTLNMANGSTGTFTISSTTRFQKNVTIQLTDLQVGNNIVATGQQNGSVFEATSIQVVTGFGGGGGGGNAQPGQTPTP